MSKIWGVPPLKTGPKTTYFLTFFHYGTLQLNGNFYGMSSEWNMIQTSENGIRNCRVLVPKLHEPWPTKRREKGPHFYQPSINSAFCFTARLRTLRSANKQYKRYIELTKCHKTLGSSLLKKCGPTTHYFRIGEILLLLLLLICTQGTTHKIFTNKKKIHNSVQTYWMTLVSSQEDKHCQLYSQASACHSTHLNFGFKFSRNSAHVTRYKL